MKRLLILLVAMALALMVPMGLPLVTQGSATADITVFDQDRPGWESAVVCYEEEFFTDTTLNPGVSVVSDYPGYVDTTKGVWWDRLVCPASGLTTTTWQFDPPTVAFGGIWDPGIPGGPGAHIAVAINGSWVSVGEIPRTYTGEFWGFVSTVPFSQVRLEPGSYCGPAWCETYELDNMVYSVVDTTPPAAVTDLRAEAIDLTSTGFVYPTGKKPTIDPPYPYGYAGGEAKTYYEFEGVKYAGWLARGGYEDDLDYKRYKFHIGQDIPANVQDAVYPIADGDIVYISYGAGWGPGNCAIFIEHRLNDESPFWALYGHLDIDSLNRYDLPAHSDWVEPRIHVDAGKAFAEIGAFYGKSHLHFGIHPGTEKPDAQEYEGHPEKNIGYGRMGLNHWDDPPPANTNGFVDPIQWITTQAPDSPLNPASVVLSWTAPANDGNDAGSGPAAQYDIRYSTREITEANWESATPCMAEPHPGEPGSTDTFVVTGLFPATPYYFALRTYDEVGNLSGLSNVTWEITAGIGWYLCSPADMIVTDPDGLTISKELNEIPGATYLEVDLDGDGELDDQVSIPERKIGDYLINVVPESGASPTDTYSLEVLAGGVTIVLAEDVQIADIPPQGYIVRSTETEIVQIIPAAIDFDPDTLNLKSAGKVVTVYIEFPTGYDVGQIDISSITLNGVVPALAKPTKLGDYDADGILDLMVKFNRSDVASVLAVGEEILITLAGEVAGITFEGSDTIRVMAPGRPPAPPPAPGVGSTWEYLVDYDGAGYTEVDHPFTVTLTEVNVVPPDFVCVPPAGVTVTHPLCNHYETDTNPDGDCPPNPTKPKRLLWGFTVIPMSVDTWDNPANGTPAALYAPMCFTAPLPLGLVNGEAVYTDYTAVSGTIGYPYALSDKWTYTSYSDVEILGDCVAPATNTLTVEVVAVDVSVTVPAGTFSDCVYMQKTENGVCSVETWWSPTVMSIVKQVDPCSFDGVETWELASYNLE